MGLGQGAGRRGFAAGDFAVCDQAGSVLFVCDVGRFADAAGLCAANAAASALLPGGERYRSAAAVCARAKRMVAGEFVCWPATAGKARPIRFRFPARKVA